TFPERQKEEVAAILSKYIHGVQKGIQDGNWEAANMAIEDIKDFQKKYGYKVLPSETRLKAEILYNKLMIFERLTPFYFFIGFISLVLIFIQIFKPDANLKKAGMVVVALLFIAFLIHTFGLGLRWYVADHAPWTDAYESMLFISWAVALAGIVFARKSLFVLASVGIFAGVFLFAAHLGWLDPQITTIVPVLKSYWLLLHVSVLTASYGFLGLAAVLGLLILIFFAIKYEKLLGKERVKRLEAGIKEAIKISELSLIIGLSLIIIGNFLGAIWANESWGRYWGWDPKETWTAVSILVYAAIVHLKYIPKWYSYYKMAVFSVLGYFAILMTYFGVNYYLSGLHSYAAGDPVPIPTWVYWAVGILFVLIVLAYRNRKLST
ncbi:cytochrome c biogenesis protein, partial [Persephonella sp.]